MGGNEAHESFAGRNRNFPPTPLNRKGIVGTRKTLSETGMRHNGNGNVINGR